VSRRILLGYLGLVVVVLAALEVPLGIEHGRTQRRDLEGKVERDAVAIASLAEDAVRRPTRVGLARAAAVAYRYRRDTGGRVVIVNAQGRALIDTNPRQAGAESFASRPEIAAALRGRVAAGTRPSTTLHTSLLYVAVPLGSGGRVDGAVRITYPTSAVDSRILRYWLILAAIAAIVLLFAAVIGVRFAAFVGRPLRRLEGAAAAAGAGDLTVRAPEDEGPPEVRSLASVFNETTAKLEQLLRSQEEFVADASHQLRTPLTALRLRLENLERDVGPPGRPEFDAALTEVERLAGLIDGLLVLARADADATPLGRVELGELVRERVDAWSSLADERGLRLVAEVDGRPAARAAVERVRQVIDNLVENAVEASPPGGTVTVGARSAPPWTELRVRDEGPGLSLEERRRAFDRFWRSRGGEGSGLGLAIVRRLVVADGGTVELIPANGQGLQAVVRLRPGLSPYRPECSKITSRLNCS
jgi:signal transduction histidine kinase